LRNFETWPGAARQLFDDAVLVVAEFVDVDLGVAELDAPLFRVLRFLEELRDVQQRLRRDAAAIQAHAAGILLVVDEGDLHAKVGGIEGSCVAAGAGADRLLRGET
jgi:hypothetical protein